MEQQLNSASTAIIVLHNADFQTNGTFGAVYGENDVKPIDQAFRTAENVIQEAPKAVPIVSGTYKYTPEQFANVQVNRDGVTRTLAGLAQNVTSAINNKSFHNKYIETANLPDADATSSEEFNIIIDTLINQGRKQWLVMGATLDNGVKLSTISLSMRFPGIQMFVVTDAVGCRASKDRNIALTELQQLTNVKVISSGDIKWDVSS